MNPPGVPLRESRAVITFIRLAANPGPYAPTAVPPAPDHLYINALIVLGIIILAVAGFLFLAFVEDESDGAAIGALIAFVLAVGAFIGAAFTPPMDFSDAFDLRWASDEKSATTTADETHANAVKAKTAYDAEYFGNLRSWLHTDYGIDADDGGILTLRDGGQLVASTPAGQRMVHLVPTTFADQIAVQVVGGDVLQPVSGK
jgi:hypothetical protein